MPFRSCNTFKTEGPSITTQAQMGYRLGIMNAAITYRLGLTVSFAGTGTFAFAEETFRSGGSAMMLERVLFGLDLSADGLDVAAAHRVRVVGALGDRRLLDRIDVGQDLILEGLVDEGDVLLIELSYAFAFDALDQALLGESFAGLGVHEGGAEHTEHMIAFQIDEGALGVGAFSTADVLGGVLDGFLHSLHCSNFVGWFNQPYNWKINKIPLSPTNLLPFLYHSPLHYSFVIYFQDRVESDRKDKWQLVQHLVKCWVNLQLIERQMQRIRTLLRNGFSITKQNQSIMVFASYPVGLPVLSTLAKNYPASALTVVTHYTPPKAKLINEVETLCRDKNIKCYYPIKKNGSAQERNQEWLTFEKEILNEGKQQWPDLGIVCSYGYMIPKHIVSNFKRGILLAHPSLVPKYRGGSPIFHAIANGERESGVSYMEVSPDKFDHGNILYQTKTQLGENQTYEEVERKLSQLAAQNIQHVIDNLESLRPGINQNDIDVSSIPAEQLKSPIIKDKQLNFNMPAEKVYNWSRALIIPRVRFQGQQIIVKFQRNILQDVEKKYKAGQLVSVGKKLFLKCSDKLLELKQWQEITKGALPIHTFINRFIGDRKGYKNDLYFE